MPLPLLAADLMFAKVNMGRAYSDICDWEDEDNVPMVGEHVRVADGGCGPWEAVIYAIAEEGTITLTIPAFAQ